MSDDTGLYNLLDKLPDPIWIYDLASLQILAANDAASRRLGYPRDVLLNMTIADLGATADEPEEFGVHRLIAMSREEFFVDIRTEPVDWNGKTAKLVCARDVTRLVKMEREQASLLASERRRRLTAEASAQRYQSVFEAVPGRFLILTADDFQIIGASDAYLKATLTRRADIEGRGIFEVFPDDPDDPHANATRNLRASLERVAATGRTDVMAVQRYPIRRPASAAGGSERRYWLPINTPVLDPLGRTVFILHRVDDVTNLIRLDERDQIDVNRPNLAEAGADQLPLDIVSYSRELLEVNRRLDEQEANLRTAKRLLGLGTWKLEMETGEVTWSDNLYDVYGIARSAFGHRFDDYVALVHPEDRPDMLSNFDAFLSSDDTQFSFHHRIVRTDGQVIHVRGLGERIAGLRGTIISGVAQDVTAQVKTGARLAAANDLLRIAGRIGRVGGWRVTLGTNEAEWSEETAAIHDLPGPRRLSIEEGISFYTPEGRERIQEVFTECAEAGKPWDQIFNIVTATGRHVWVRTIGEAVRAADGSIVAVHGAIQDISEVVAVRQQSEEIAQRLHQTLNSMSDAFFTLDGEWRFSFLNDHALQLLRRDRAALEGRSILEAFPEAIGSSFQTFFESAISEHRTVRFTEFYPPLDKWFQVTAYPMPEGLAVYFRDITQERADQAQLRLLESAVSRQGDMLVITEAGPIDGPGPAIVYVNDAFTRITGYRREDVIGKTPRLLQGPDTQASELRRIREALAARRPVRSEVLNYTKSGQELWLELDIVPIGDDFGHYTHWVAVQRDVTERRRAEAALRMSEERFRFIARATNDVVWDWDFRTQSVWWNETMRSLFGYEAGQLEPGPESWLNRLHPDDADRVIAGIHAVIDGEGSTWADEYRFLRADGSAAIVADRGFVIRDHDGKAVRMLGSMHDVTERRRLDERLRESQKLEALGQLTGGIAHDFNNLLTVILGNAEIVTERLTNQSELQALAKMITAAAERGAELTDRLLAYARRQALEPTTVDVGELVVGMGGLLRRAVPETIEIRFIQCAQVCLAEVDEALFESALLNLVINARDAMSEGGLLIIEAACVELGFAEAAAIGALAAGPYVRISVTDTGSGMTPEVVARAFDPFFTTKGVGTGTGLGLSMVYGFVKQSGGEARILSDPVRGTSVELYLPPSGAGMVACHTPLADREAIGGSEHILVVEDDDLVRRQVLGQLNMLGYRVTAVEGGAQALEVLAGSEEIDLLFTDVMMPGMTGWQLMETALELRPGLKVLLTSGFTDDAVGRKERIGFGVDLLPKPYRRQELALAIRQVLDK